MDKGRKAKKKSALVAGPVADRVMDLQKKASSGKAARVKAIVDTENKYNEKNEEGSKNHTGGTGSKYNSEFYRNTGRSIAVKGKSKGAVNAMVGSQVDVGGSKLAGTDSKAVMRKAKRSALANKNRSKQAVASDKRRFKAY